MYIGVGSTLSGEVKKSSKEVTSNWALKDGKEQLFEECRNMGSRHG